MHRLLLALDPVARVADDAHRHRTRQADVLHARPGRHDRGVLQDRQHRLRIPQPRLDRADDVIDILRTIKGRTDIRLDTAIPRLLVCESCHKRVFGDSGFLIVNAVEAARRQREVTHFLAAEKVGLSKPPALVNWHILQRDCAPEATAITSPFFRIWGSSFFTETPISEETWAGKSD